MPDKVIQIDGFGTVAFPDSMSDDDIAQVIRKQHPDLAPSPAQAFLNGLKSSPIAHPIDTAVSMGGALMHPGNTLDAMEQNRQQTVDRASQAFRKGNYTQAAIHGALSLIPVIGPQLSEHYQEMRDAQDRGDDAAEAEAAGKMTGLAGSVEAGRWIPEAITTAPKLVTAVKEAGTNAATFAGAAAKEGGADLAMGTTKTAAGLATAKTGNVAAEIGLGYPLVRSGVKQAVQGAKAGYLAGVDAVRARLETIKQAAFEREIGGPVPPPAGAVDTMPAAEPPSQSPLWAPAARKTAPMKPGAPVMPEQNAAPADPFTPEMAASAKRAGLDLFMQDLSPEMRMAAAKANYRAFKEGAPHADPNLAYDAAHGANHAGEAAKATAAARAIAHTLNLSEVPHDDFASLPLAEQQKWVGDIADSMNIKDALHITNAGRVSQRSVAETLFELRALEKAGQAAAK